MIGPAFTAAGVLYVIGLTIQFRFWRAGKKRSMPEWALARGQLIGISFEVAAVVVALLASLVAIFPGAGGAS